MDRLDRDRLDLLHLDRLPAPVRLRRDPVEHRVQLELPELHADHGRSGSAPLRRLVARVGERLVQGPDPARQRGGARAHRGAVRRCARRRGRAGDDRLKPGIEARGRR